MMAKWLCHAAVRLCGNGCWRYKSLVFRFDLRCFQIQTTRFPTKIQGFTHSIHHFQTKISPISHTIPQLHDAIPSFPNQNLGKSTHKSTVPQLGYAAFKPRLLDFSYFSGSYEVYLRLLQCCLRRKRMRLR